MKYNPVYLFLICLVAFSCSKNQSSSSFLKIKLVKTITNISNSGSANPRKEIDSFVYDNNQRIIHFTASWYSGLFIQTAIHYAFSYSGSDTVPRGYTLSYGPIGVPNSVDNYSGEHTLLVNAQDQIILDSVIVNSNPNGINRYTEYAQNLVVQSWGTYNSGLFFPIQIDSFLLDGDNVKQQFIGINMTPGTGQFTYQRIWAYTYTFDQVGNPLFNTSAFLIPLIAKGTYPSKTCPLTCTFSSADTSIVVNYQNVTDLNGLLQSSMVQGTGDNSTYTYYK